MPIGPRLGPWRGRRNTPHSAGETRRYEANVRGKIDFGTVPFTLRLLMFWVSDWHRESDWYAWTFQP